VSEQITPTGVESTPRLHGPRDYTADLALYLTVMFEVRLIQVPGTGLPWTIGLIGSPGSTSLGGTRRPSGLTTGRTFERNSSSARRRGRPQVSGEPTREWSRRAAEL
jgi:hypothetical protein